MVRGFIFTSVATCSWNISKSLIFFGIPRDFSVSPLSSVVSVSVPVSVSTLDTAVVDDANDSVSVPDCASSDASPFCCPVGDTGSMFLVSLAIFNCSRSFAMDSSSVCFRCSGLSVSDSLCAYADNRSIRPTTIALTFTWGFKRATAERNWSSV